MIEKMMKWENVGEEFEDIGHLLHNKKKIVIYGIGDNGKELFDLLEKIKEYCPWEIMLVDQNVEKQREGYCGRKIWSPQELLRQDLSNGFAVVCIPEKESDKVINDLEKHGLAKCNIFLYSYFLFTYLPIYFWYEKSLLFFTSQNIIPSTVCNLKCKSCLNLTPYIKEHSIDTFESVKNDIDLFFKQVDLIYIFQLSGGEPQLYKNTGKILQYLHDNYGERIISLEMVTNGTIEPEDTLCRILKECKVKVILDDYRKALSGGEQKFETVRRKLVENGVNIKVNTVKDWFILYPSETHKNDTTEELQNFYKQCGNPYATLRNSMISGCNYAHYAEKAGLCERDKDNYFDLRQENINRLELLEFRLRYNRKGYVNFCRECGGWGKINHNREDVAIQQK